MQCKEAMQSDEKGSAGRSCMRAADHRIGIHCTFWVVQALGFQFSGTLQHIKHVRNQMPACTGQKDAAPRKPKAVDRSSFQVTSFPRFSCSLTAVPSEFRLFDLLLALPLVKGARGCLDEKNWNLATVVLLFVFGN
jgi:hypothetical protein